MKRALESSFAERGWKPFKFQKDMWRAIANGESGLLHATTGAGKTYAVWLGALMDFGAVAPVKRAQAATKNIASIAREKTAPPLTVLWITPMRALAADTLRALQQPLEYLKGQVADDDGVIHPVAPGFAWARLTPQMRLASGLAANASRLDRCHFYDVSEVKMTFSPRVTCASSY